jgi:hypothetical protein
MARYIDADLLIKNIAKIEDLRTISTKTIGQAISNTPTADVVEVVRCKDCKEFHRADKKFAQHCRIHGAMVQEDDFCSYGERKEK